MTQKLHDSARAARQAKKDSRRIAAQEAERNLLFTALSMDAQPTTRQICDLLHAAEDYRKAARLAALGRK